MYSCTHPLLEIAHCHQTTLTGVRFSEMWSHNVHLGFCRLSKLTQFCFHSFLVCDNSRKHNALLENGVFEPICYSEFPPTLLSQESLSFPRWSASTCFPVIRSICKVQIIWLELECFPHSWGWCFRFRFIYLFIFISVVCILIYPGKFM